MGNEAKNGKKVPQCTRTRKRPEQTFPCALCPATLTNQSLMKYHACRKHCDFSLFECGYCQKKFNTFDNSDIKSHMKLIHKEPNGSVDWKKLKDHRNKFTKEIRELIEKCFSTRTRKRLEQTFPCALCPATLTNRNSMKYHACRKHCDFSLFECGYCQKKFYTLDIHDIKAHMELDHKEPNGSVDWKKLKDYREKFRKEIRELTEKCFSVNDADGAGKKKERLIIGAGSELQCSLCNSVVKRRTVRGHACSHANFVIYKCGYCPQKFYGLEKSTKIRNHILNHHGREANQNNFTDNKEKLTEEINEWVEKCFADA